MHSPISFFAYKRPHHAKKSLDALSKNKECILADLFVFIDGHKDAREIKYIDEVEKVVKSYKGKFKSINIERSTENKGSARNTIDGINKVLSIYETVIDIEEDIQVSQNFLEYMNLALVRYQNNKKVFHINGYNFQVEINSEFDCIFLRNMICWGWGTWKNKWEEFINNQAYLDPVYLNKNFPQERRNYMDMNLKFSPNWSQIRLNEKSKISTLAIFWYCFIVANNGLCLTPKESLVRNIGHDKSGENCGFNFDIQNAEISQKSIIKFPNHIKEDSYALDAIRSFYKKENKLSTKIKRKLFYYFLLLKGNLGLFGRE